MSLETFAGSMALEIVRRIGILQDLNDTKKSTEYQEEMREYGIYLYYNLYEWMKKELFYELIDRNLLDDIIKKPDYEYPGIFSTGIPLFEGEQEEGDIK